MGKTEDSYGSAAMMTTLDGRGEGCCTHPAIALVALPRLPLPAHELQQSNVSQCHYSCTVAQKMSCYTPRGIRGEALVALEKTVQAIGPAILELAIVLDVLVPEEWADEVMKDLSVQQALIENLTIRNGYHAIRASLPLAATFGYSSRLKTLSQGTGSFTLHLHDASKQWAALKKAGQW